MFSVTFLLLLVFTTFPVSKYKSSKPWIKLHLKAVFVMYCKIQVLYCLLNLMDVLAECPVTPSAWSVSCFSVWCCCTHLAALPGLSSLTQQLLMYFQGPNQCLDLPQFVYPTLTHTLKQGLATFQGPCAKLCFPSILTTTMLPRAQWSGDVLLLHK